MTNRTFQAPRGTTDLLPDDQPYWRFVEGVATRAAETFGYDRIDTPTFEDAGLFVRGVGETTDIVEKETYTFEDRGGDLLSLRPEGTAPVCRAYLEHGMHNRSQPVRLHYICPMYRYDRPQAGRYRELHQFGAEAIGDADPAVDAEIIELGWSLLRGRGAVRPDAAAQQHRRPCLPPRVRRRPPGLLRVAAGQPGARGLPAAAPVEPAQAP